MLEIQNTFTQLIYNKIFLSVFLSWLASDLIKISILLFTEKKFNFSSIFRSGGMPSTHTASVIGLAIGVLLFEGIGTSFIISLAMAIVIIHDAMGVRFETEKHAIFLNELIKREKLTKSLFLEHIGHKVNEVVAGVIIGIIVPLIIYYF